MNISIFNYWHRCPKCHKEISHTSSSPLEYNDNIKCHLCGTEVKVINTLTEVQVEVILTQSAQKNEKETK